MDYRRIFVWRHHYSKTPKNLSLSWRSSSLAIIDSKFRFFDPNFLLMELVVLRFTTLLAGLAGVQAPAPSFFSFSFFQGFTDYAYGVLRA